MTQTSDREDEQWLAALAGRPDPTADPATNLQAESLRRALQAQSASLEQSVPSASEAKYQRLLFRLRQERLPIETMRGDAGTVAVWRGRSSTPAKSLGEPSDFEEYEIPSFLLVNDHRKDAIRKRRRLQVWATAALVVLSVGVVVQIGGRFVGQDDEIATLRGGGKATVLVVANPDMRLAELLAGLKAAGEDASVKRDADGRIMLTVKPSDKVLDYLGTQRIEPVVVDGAITLVLIRPKP